MKASELIQRLQNIVVEDGDVEVLLHVNNHATADDIYQPGEKIECMGNITAVTCEDDHSDGSLFVRISGDDEE
jgi:hypothetical protein